MTTPTVPRGMSRAIQRAGLLLGPALAIAVYLLTAGQPGLSDPARATLAAAALMATWWISEALPIEATALVPLVLFPLTGIAPIARAAAPYADPVIALFLGGMLLGAAMERWNLHRRIALHLLLGVGTSPARLLLGVMIATAFISMWVSNTATAIMMLPIGVSIVALVHDQRRDAPARDRDHFAKAMMLGIAYAATIGGVGTVIGSPPNAVADAFIERTYGVELSFVDWLGIGMPIMLIFLPLTWLVLAKLTHRFHLPPAPGVRELLRQDLRALGRPTGGEIITAVVFALAAVAWIVREPACEWLGLYTQSRPDGPREHLVTDPMIAIAAALVLFAIPADRQRHVLDWNVAARIPWGVLLLFGGGLSLSAAVGSTGVDTFIGQQLGGLAGAPLLVIVLLLTTIVVFTTEVGSNTAIVNIFLPIAAAVAVTCGAHPYLFIFPVALAASYAYMMPMGTPPNALVFASGHLRIADMARAGIVLNILSILVITAMVGLLAPRILGFDPRGTLPPASKPPAAQPSAR